MKFGIITHYDVHNHGALLQLNALVQVLSQKGIKAYALQFDKNYDFLGVELKNKYNISIKSVAFYLEYLKEQGVKKTTFNVKKKKLLEAFKQQQNLVGGYYTREKDLSAIVIGSDEVFALHTGPTPIFSDTHALATLHSRMPEVSDLPILKTSKRLTAFLS